MSPHRRPSPSIAAAACLLIIGQHALPDRADAVPTSLPMIPSQWHAASPAAWVGRDIASIRFDDRDEGFPDGVMTVNGAVAVSNAAHFTSGTIDFDIKPLAYDDTGVVFRRDGNDGGEFFYLRGDPNCPASDDCYQYAPIVHAMLQWNVYPNYQGPAPIAPAGWNHVHIVVAAHSMSVTLNHAAEPTLVVPTLQGLTATGGIGLKGPASYANLIIDPAAVSLTDVHAPPPDPDALTAWQASRPVAWPAGRPVPAALIPQSPDAWQPIGAEPWGLVDIARRFAHAHGEAAEIGWLRTTIDTASAERRLLRLGWANQVTVFLDGRRIFSGDNPYYPVAARISADGRLAPDNASIPLTLHAGRNDLVLAVGNGWPDAMGALVAGHDGWAAEAHLDPIGR